MSLTRGLAGAIVAGLVGAALWAALASATGFHLTLLAIIVGGFVGNGMRIATRARGGTAAGMLAAVAGVLCILGGRFSVAYIMAGRAARSDVPSVTMADARTELAEQVLTEFEDKGVEMTDPEGSDAYPPEVMVEADRRWRRMAPGQREEFRAGLEQDSGRGVRQPAGPFDLSDFGIFDLVCIGLGIGTAYKTAATTREDDLPEIIEEAHAPAMMNVAKSAAAAAGVAPAAAGPSPAVQPQLKDEAPATGLGIFSILGKEPEPVEPTRSILTEAPQETRSQRPPFIDLELGDEREAA